MTLTNPLDHGDSQTIWKKFRFVSTSWNDDAWKPVTLGGYSWIVYDSEFGDWGQCHDDDLNDTPAASRQIHSIPRHELPIPGFWTEWPLDPSRPKAPAGFRYVAKYHYNLEYEGGFFQHDVTEGAIGSMPAIPGGGPDPMYGDDECYDKVVQANILPRKCGNFEQPTGGLWRMNSNTSSDRNEWGDVNNPYGAGLPYGYSGVDQISRANECVAQIVEALDNLNDDYCVTTFPQVMLRNVATVPISWGGTPQWEPYTQHNLNVIVDSKNKKYTIGRDNSYKTMDIP